MSETESRRIEGLHHVTALATSPQINVEFYTDVLGLRLVKRTVNFDDPGTYHLYYGDAEGRPGTILTFFPWPNSRRGSRGAGQATVTSFSVPEGSLGYWQERLAGLQIPVEEITERGGEETLVFLDPDGLKLQLVVTPDDADTAPWTGGSVPGDKAIRRFHGVTLTVGDGEASAALLAETLGFPLLEEGTGGRYRFDGGRGARVELAATGEGFGRIAAGTVHHVAWRVADEAEQLAWRQRLLDAGMQVTPVLDRQYFKSIYFREPGGVLFEIATDPPGFTRDESPDALGTELKLPPWLEPERERIAAALPELGADSTGGTP